MAVQNKSTHIAIIDSLGLPNIQHLHTTTARKAAGITAGSKCDIQHALDNQIKVVGESTYYDNTKDPSTINITTNLTTWASIEVSTLKIKGNPARHQDKDKYKTWGRVKVADEITPDAIEIIAREITKINDRVNAENKITPGKYKGWGEQTLAGKFAQVTDGSVDQEGESKHIAPDHIKERYFEMLERRPQINTRTKHQIDEIQWLENRLETEGHAYIWVAYPGDTASKINTPKRENIIAQDRCIVSTIKLHPKNKKIIGLAPLKYTLHLPESPTREPHSHVEGMKDNRRLFGSPFENMGQFMHNRWFGWGTITDYNKLRNTYEVTYASGSTRTFTPEQIEEEFFPPATIKKMDQENRLNGEAKLWTLDHNNREYKVNVEILAGLRLSDLHTNPDQLGWEETTETDPDEEKPTRRAPHENLIALGQIKSLAFTVKFTHDATQESTRGPRAYTIKTMKWAQQEKDKRDPTSWAAWLSTTCNLSPSDINPHINRVISEDFDLSRNTYILATILNTARRESHRTMWEHNGSSRLICPCLHVGLGLNCTKNREESCAQAQNEMGLRGNHDKTLWAKVILEDLKYVPKRPIRKTKFYCPCGRHYPSAKARNEHVINAESLEPHGVFFDELNHMGGSTSLVDLEELTVLHAQNFRIPVNSTNKPESTTAEAYTWCQGVIAAHHILPPDAPLQTWIDSQSAQAMAITATSTTPLTSKDRKKPTSNMTTTMRNIMSGSEASENKHAISTTWRAATHNLAWDDDTFTDIFTRMNSNADKGAEEGRLHFKVPEVKGDEQEEEGTAQPEETDTPKTDYGSQADQRSSPTQHNTGHVISFTHQKHHILTPFSRTSNGIRASAQLQYLADGDKVGTTARAIMANIVSTQSTTYLRKQVEEEVEAFQLRCTYGRWIASSYEVARKLNANKGAPFPSTIESLGRLSEVCLLCEDHTKRDDLIHGRHECKENGTTTGREAVDRITSECTGRTGPCKLPPYRQSYLAPKYRSPTGRFSPSNYGDKIPPFSVQLAEAEGRVTYETPHTWEIEWATNPNIAHKATHRHDENEESTEETIEADHLTRLDQYLAKTNLRRVSGNLGRKSGDGRTFSDGIQRLPGKIRAKICKHMFDIDFNCSHPSIIIDALRQKQIRIPRELYYVVINRMKIRKQLALYYQCKPPEVKGLINAITYGRTYQSKTFFKDAKIPIKRHHHIIKQYCRAIESIVTKLAQDDDCHAARLRHPEKSERQIKFSALSSLLARIEDQKLSCVINRLTTYWGINPKSLVLMHDGCMVEMMTIRQDGQAAKENKTAIDQQILQDLTSYARESLGVFIRLTVKSGSNATEVTCNMAWPILPKEEMAPEIMVTSDEDDDMSSEKEDDDDDSDNLYDTDDDNDNL